MNKISTSLSQETINRFIEFEGKANHLYLDGPGLVTVGIGCRVTSPESATKLNFFHKTSHQKASYADIVDEYLTVKKSIPSRSISYYNSFTFLYLPDEDIIHLFEVRLNDKISALRFHFLEFDSYPTKVQDVLLDMAYNLGISGLINKFPKFCEAIKLRKWNIAAKESHRNGIQDSRNIWAYESLNSI